jgi:hypothetical protein
LITVVVVASEKVNQPKSFSRRAFVPRTDHRFHTSSGLGGFDHELVQEVSAKAAKPVTPKREKTFRPNHPYASGTFTTN